MTYFDKWGRLHHKPCVNGEPSSNNGWIYTAYYHKLHNVRSTIINNEKLVLIGEQCSALLTRHPVEFKLPSQQVPISRDEILGLAYLGFLTPEHLSDWNFCPFILKKFNPFKLITQLWELRPEFDFYSELHPTKDRYIEKGPWFVFKHRNYFWQNNLDQIYRFAFSVPLQDRAFLLECWGETKSPRYFFYKGIAWLDSKFTKPKNGIHWLKYGGEDRKKIMQAEFPEDHPLRR